MAAVAKAMGTLHPRRTNCSATAIMAAAATTVTTAVATQGGEEEAQQGELACAGALRHRLRMSLRLSYRTRRLRASSVLGDEKVFLFVSWSHTEVSNEIIPLFS